MCQDKAHGGQRCAMSATANVRRVVIQRIRRHEKAGVDTTGDVALVGRLDAAKARYGPIVTPLMLEFPDSVNSLFTLLQDGGLRPLVIGGSVRDALVDGRTPKDIDVEVYGGDIDEVSRTLRTRHRVDEVGRSFGVLKLTLEDGVEIDVSVPRRDNHVGAGHRGFTIETDTNMTVEEAAARRDFTINAMGFDPEYGVVVDPYHGQQDLKNNILRATSDAFAEDPLRVLRGFQFAARYGMNFDVETVNTCRKLLPRAVEIPTERVRGEWWKFYSKGGQAVHGLSVLADTRWDQMIPGLAEVNNRDLWSKIEKTENIVSAEMLDAAQQANLKAAVIAETMDDETARKFMSATLEGGDNQRSAYGLSRCETSEVDSTPTSIRQWAHTLSARRTNISQWVRYETATGSPDHARTILTEAERLGCVENPQPDLVTGQNIIDRFSGLRPGRWTGEIQRAARQAQIEGVFVNQTGAEQWLMNYPNPDM